MMKDIAVLARDASSQSGEIPEFPEALKKSPLAAPLLKAVETNPETPPQVADQTADQITAGTREHTATSKSTEKTEDTYVPPFPDRENLFQKPAVSKVLRSPDLKTQSGEEIKLLGFVRVEGLKALVAIDGEVVALREGQTAGSLRIISISPPQVTFQKGRRRWTDELYAPAVKAATH